MRYYALYRLLSRLFDLLEKTRFKKQQQEKKMAFTDNVYRTGSAPARAKMLF